MNNCIQFPLPNGEREWQVISTRLRQSMRRGGIGHHPGALPGRDNAALTELTMSPETYIKLLFNRGQLLRALLAGYHSPLSRLNNCIGVACLPGNEYLFRLALRKKYNYG